MSQSAAQVGPRRDLTVPPVSPGPHVVRLPLTPTDVGHLRFASSPLTEVAHSLRVLASGRVPKIHQEWLASLRGGLPGVDLELLQGVVAARSCVADFFHDGLNDGRTTIDDQLGRVAAMPQGRLVESMELVWRGAKLPGPVEQLLRRGEAAPRCLADELARYWAVALAPHWTAMRSLFDGDVAFRTMRLIRGGVGAMLADLEPAVTVHGELMTIRTSAEIRDGLTTGSVVLIPSVFTWPEVRFVPGSDGLACLTYPARALGTQWPAGSADAALGTLLGRSRALMLAALERPASTSDLAEVVGESGRTVSQHLVVLKRNGLVYSRRAGRSVLHQRTELATSMVATRAEPVEVPRS